MHFALVPSKDPTRGGNSDLVVLLFGRSGRPVEQWRSIFDGEDHSLLRRTLRTALGAETLTFQHAQCLDYSETNDRGDVRVTEVLADSGLNSPLNISVCAEARRRDVVRGWEVENGETELILLPAKQYLSYRDSNPQAIDGPTTNTAAAGLAVFDMDSTLILQETVDELARKAGCYDKVSAITEAAMRGEAPYASDFAASLRARVALLRGLPVSVWDELRRDAITLAPGARELIRALRVRGWRTAVLSGGFMPLAEWLKNELGLDYASANVIIEDSKAGVLTGQLDESVAIVDGARKEALLRELADRFGVSLSRTIAVGDGSNDLPMLSTAGLGIAFNAKPKVQATAPARLNAGSLLEIMHVLGYTKDELISRLL